MRIAVINGPNLGMLGKREVGIYGLGTLVELETQIEQRAVALGASIEFFCSNVEGEIIDFIHKCTENCQGIVINAGALSHYSYSLRDALSCIEIPAIEVHISNVFKRETFRHTSVIAPVCLGTIAGFGVDGYFYAIDKLTNYKGDL